MSEMLMAQDLLKTEDSYVRGGFNTRLLGGSFRDVADNNPRQPYCHGFNLAERMIEEGKIFYTHIFKCECGGSVFQYGTTWICRKCDKKNREKPWWIIKVFMDGNAWCCIGLDFINLQESENYAFGNTRQEAIDEYDKIMKART